MTALFIPIRILVQNGRRCRCCQLCALWPHTTSL